MNAIIAIRRMMFSTRNVRFSKMRTLISGDSVRRSTKKNTTSKTTPAAMLILDGRVAPAPQARLLEPEHAQPDPGDDQRQAPVVHLAGRASFGGLEMAISASAIRATGMLIQKIARQGPLDQVPAGDRADRGQSLRLCRRTAPGPGHASAGRR
jgi:hypothetical protein